MTNTSKQDPSGAPRSLHEANARRSSPSKVGLIAAWALSLVLAFLLGMASRPAAPAPVAAPPVEQSAPASPEASTPGGEQTPEADPEQEKQVIELLKSLPKRDPNDKAAMGKVDAKVVLIEWSDYRCPFCALWGKQTLPALQKYVDEGTLRVEFRDLAIFGDQSKNVAIGAHAAGEQGKFWEFQHAVYAAAPASGHPDIDQAKILSFAKTAEVPDLAKFEKDLKDPKFAELVDNNSAEAKQLGITGTPFFVINTKVINGAQPTENFIEAIEAAKKEA